MHEKPRMMTRDGAVDTINDALNLDARVTVRENEIKCAFRDDEGGSYKGYLGAADCAKLSAAFYVLSKELARGDGSPKEGA